MKKIETFTVRMTGTERQLVTRLAAHLERNESDTLRLILREKARELGLYAQPSQYSHLVQVVE